MHLEKGGLARNGPKSPFGIILIQAILFQKLKRCKAMLILLHFHCVKNNIQKIKLVLGWHGMSVLPESECEVCFFLFAETSRWSSCC